ncbi:MAG: SDR family NAD(P)-dependent oxidoreductase [Verrucomicrobia bacterium]|nr:SDR family NAD(P)-dependent oxidoreductase [Verrucomicrobiota bacterium]
MSNAIAVVGMSGRFPGALDVDAFWKNVCQGVESIARFSADQLAAEGISPSIRADPRFVNAGGALDGIELFDAGLFGYNPREAEIIDPQHRIFLECAWESLEHAGYNPFGFAGLIGVYAGTGPGTYQERLKADPELAALVGHFQLSTGNEKDHLTTRVAYKLNLHGPAVTIQTTCSSSLVAVALACQGLLTRQCDVALAGGVSIVVPQRTGYFYTEGGILSPDGRCRAFDAQAQGAVGGNGCGIVVLRRLDDALANGDHVHALITGAAINNDGSRKVGYTAPSVDGQAEVITRAHAMAGVSPDQIGYVEAHGTGTPLGDPIEVAALTEVFRKATGKCGYCALGSVKTNVGHLDAAAGVTGLIKAVLAVEHGQIPPTLHFREANPALNLPASPFFVNRELRAWPGSRRAGVSSFGIGGTNAHVVVAQSPPRPPVDAGREHQLIVLSGRTSDALDAVTSNLARHLSAHPELELADVAHTLQSGRVPLPHRRTLVATNRTEAVTALAGRLPARVAAGSSPPVAFLFPGQGAQHVRMAARVYATEPLFRAELDRAAELLRPWIGLDLRRIIFPDEGEITRAQECLRQTAIAQPALFAVEYALAQLWMRWGVRPDALFGHSVGEYVAACVSGTFSFEDGLALVAERGRLVQATPQGAMLAVPLGETAVRALLDGALSLAAVNGPAQCVVSGPEAAIAALERTLASRGLPGSRLHTSHAFHSAMMDPILKPFAARLGATPRHEPVIPWIANLHGGWISDTEATDPSYWTAHLRGTVRFGDGLRTLLEDPDRILLEVGPGQTLTGLARLHGAAGERVLMASLPHSLDRGDDERHLIAALGQLFLAGVNIDWGGFQGHVRRRRVALPAYPFERQRYWIDAKPRRSASAAPVSSPVIKAGSPDDWVWVPVWRRTAPVTSLDLLPGPWLVFDDGGALGEAVARELTSNGRQVVRVMPGVTFDRAGPHEFRLDPDHEPHYRQLIGTLKAEMLTPARVVHLWSLAGHERTNLYGLLFLAQAWTGAGQIGSLEIVAVSRSLYDVTGSEALQVNGALLLGPCKVIPQEFSHVRCRNIDLDVGTDPAMLVAELAGGCNEPVVACRGSHRWVQEFEKLPPAAPQPSVLREGGTYLVTGGLGDVGLALAETIARTVRANLVLIGRAEIPARRDWLTWVAVHGNQDPISRKLARVQTLERLGARVLPMSADVCNATRLRVVIDQIKAEFGPLHGVIHAAGATEADAFGPVKEMAPAACERHLRPKVDGLRVLDSALKDEHLDFCVLVSSLSAVLGGLGFAAYAAANAFMDAFAAGRARGGARWMSINWDGWDFSCNPRKGRLALTRDEGMAVFRKLLSSGVKAFPAQVAVSTGDLNARVDQWVRLTSVRTETSAAEADPIAGTHERPTLDNEYKAPENDVERFVAQVWQSLLGINRIGRHDDFFSLGGHSLLAIQAASRLRDAFRVEVSVHALFEAPTVARLAGVLNDALAAAAPSEDLAEILDQVEHLSDEEVAALLAEAPEPPRPTPSSPPSPERFLTNDVVHAINRSRATDGLAAKTAIQCFYDSINGQLNAGVASEHALFLNYGYVPDGRGERSVHQLPGRVLNRNRIQLVLEVVGDCELAGRRVLDVGCGRGGAVAVLHQFFSPAKIVGLDLSPGAIEFCRRVHHYPEVSFMCGDAEHLPFPAGSFDGVINIESSHSYPDVTAFYAEVHRILEPGGVFLYADTIPAGEVASRLELVSRQGFEMELARDITPNVVRSCEELAGINAQAFTAGNAPEVLDDFLAVPGSENYNRLRSGRLVYGIWRLRKI